MSYILNRTNGDALVTVNDNTVNSEYALTFIGKNYVAYGEKVDENFLRLLENNANSSAPDGLGVTNKPVVGQTFYNTTNKTLNFCYAEAVGAVAAKFKKIAVSNSGGTQPDAAASTVGDIWWDSTNGVLKVYNGSAWGSVFTQTQADWAQSTTTAADYIKNKPSTFASSLTIQNAGNNLTTAPTQINFSGSGVTASLVSGGNILVNIPGSTGTALALKDEGSTLTANTTSINFVGAGVTATNSSTDVTVTIPGASAVTTLAQLTGDVAITGGNAPVNGQVLKYNSSTSKWSPAASSAASTTFTIASKDGSAKSLGVVLTPGTWQAILETKIISVNDFTHEFTVTQTATVGSVTLNTSVLTISLRGGQKNGIGGSGMDVGEFTITEQTAVTMTMAAIEGLQSLHVKSAGSTLTISKIESTDAGSLYSGTAPTFNLGVGVGQTWSNPTRSGGSTLYQNTTGAPIFVVITDTGFEDPGGNLQVSTDNSTWIVIGTAAAGVPGTTSTVGGIIPNNSYYRYTGYPDGWAELR
jgi:hypothetical protein